MGTPRPNASGPIVSGAGAPATALALRIISSPALACISRRRLTTRMVVSGSNTPRMNATSASLATPLSCAMSASQPAPGTMARPWMT